MNLSPKNLFVLCLCAMLFAVFSVPGTLFAGEVNDFLLDVLGIEFQDISSSKKAFFFKYIEDIGVRFGASGNAGGFVPSGDPVRLGIGKDPTAELDVAGTVQATGFTFPTGAAANKILTTADANGGMFWSGLGTLLQALTGYSATANQVLKNNSGTLGWGTVDTISESDPKMPVCTSGQVPTRTLGTDGTIGTVDDVWSCAPISVTQSQISDLDHFTNADESDPIFAAQKGAAGGVATLGTDSRVPSYQLPKLVITDVLVQPLSAVDTAGERDTLEIEQGDVIIDAAANKTYIWSGTEWKEIIAPNTVTSVNGETGTVSLSLNDISDVDVTTCTLNHVLKWNGMGWSCLPDSDSDVWTTLTGGIKYTGGNVGIGTTLADEDVDFPLTVQGDVAAGGFVTAGTVSADSGVFTRGGNIVAQSVFSNDFKYVAGERTLIYATPRCNTLGTGGKLNCDISNALLDCGSGNYGIGTDPGSAPPVCYDQYLSVENAPAKQAYTLISSETTGGWVTGNTGFGDTISIGGDSGLTVPDAEIRINTPPNSGRNLVSFTNPGVPGGLADIRAKKGFFESLFVTGDTSGTAGKVLTSDGAGNASWQPAGSGADNWGTQVVVRDASLKGNGTTATPLGLMACAAGQEGYVLKWNSTTSTWGCDTDNSGGGSVWSSPDASGRISYTAGSVGIGTAAPTGKLDINSTQSVTQVAATIYNSDSNTIAGLASGHPVQIGDYITLGGQGPFPVTSRGSVSVDISGAFIGTVANQNSYTLIKRNLLGGGNTYAGNLITGDVDTDTIQIRTGASANKFLKSTDANGNAVWADVPPAYADANVETWVESKMVDGDFSATPSTAKIKSALLPALAITNTFPITVTNSDTQTKCQTAVTGLANANEGDVAICAGINKTYILTVEGGRATFSNWSEIKAPNQVTSVNGQTGAVTINTDDADASPTNEAQTLTYTDSTRAVNLSAVGTTGGGSFTLPQGSKWTDVGATGIAYAKNATIGRIGDWWNGVDASTHVSVDIANADTTGNAGPYIGLVKHCDGPCDAGEWNSAAQLKLIAPNTIKIARPGGSPINYDAPANLVVTGNVGIGTNTTGDRALTITGAGSGDNAACNAALLNLSDGVSGNYWHITHRGTCNQRGSLMFWFRDEDNVGGGNPSPEWRNVLTMLPNGNVGIGTASPGAKLEVKGDAGQLVSGAATLSQLGGDKVLSASGLGGAFKVGDAVKVMRNGITNTHITTIFAKDVNTITLTTAISLAINATGAYDPGAYSVYKDPDLFVVKGGEPGAVARVIVDKSGTLQATNLIGTAAVTAKSAGGGGGGLLGFTAPGNVSGNLIWTLPSANPTSNDDVLGVSDFSAGTLTWKPVNITSNINTMRSTAALGVGPRPAGNTYPASAPYGLASLDANQKILVSELPDAVVGGTNYVDVWNASLMTSLPTPSLTVASSDGYIGKYYVVSVAGNAAGAGIGDITNLPGSSYKFAVGDYIISNGTVWQRIHNTSLDTAINANTNVSANTATRHAAMSLGTTVNGLSLSGQVLSLAAASDSQNGALTSTDWSTFNSKQSALSATNILPLSSGGTGLDLSRGVNAISGKVGKVLGAISGTALGWVSTESSQSIRPYDEVDAAGLATRAVGHTQVACTRADTDYNCNVTGSDPRFITGLTTDAEKYKYIEITYKTRAGDTAAGNFSSAISYTGTFRQTSGTVTAVSFPINTDDKWHTAIVDISGWESGSVGVRLDFPETNAVDGQNFTIGYIAVGNLGSGLDNVYAKGGNVGIGTAGPEVKIDAVGSGSGILTVVRLQNSVTAANNSAAQLMFGANRATGGLTNVAGIAGMITDIAADAYKGALVFSTANNAAPVERMRINNTGAVGIGTDSPGALLSLESDAALANTAEVARFSRKNKQSPYDNKWFLGADGGLTMNNNNYDTFILKGGNVGINATSPSAALTVEGKPDNSKNGTLTLGNTTSPTKFTITTAFDAGTFSIGDVVRGDVTPGSPTPSGYTGYIEGTISAINTTSGDITLSGDDWFITSSGGGAVGSGQVYSVTVTRNSNLFLVRDGANPPRTAFTINRLGNAIFDNNVGVLGTTILGGNVGIGTASPPSLLSLGGTTPYITTDSADGSDNKVIVVGGGGGISSARGAVIQVYGNEHATAPGQIFIDGGNVTNGDINFRTDNAQSRLFIEQGTGNVGIGLTSPNTKLHVRMGTVDENLIFTGPFSFTTGTRIQSENNGGGSLQPLELRASAFDFVGGNVGIGTAPSASNKLEVAGNIKATGNINAGGNVTIGGTIKPSGGYKASDDTPGINGDVTVGCLLFIFRDGLFVEITVIEGCGGAAPAN